MAEPREHGGHRLRTWDGPSLLADFSPEAAAPADRRVGVVRNGAHAVGGFEVPFLPEPPGDDGGRGERSNPFPLQFRAAMRRMVHGLHTPELWRGEQWNRTPSVVTYDLRLAVTPARAGPGRIRMFLLVKAFAHYYKAARAEEARAAAAVRAVSAARLLQAVAPRVLTLQPLRWSPAPAAGEAGAVGDADLGLVPGYKYVGELRRENVLSVFEPPAVYQDFTNRLLPAKGAVSGNAPPIVSAPARWPGGGNDLLPTCGVLAAAPQPVVLSVRLQPTLRTRDEHRALIARQMLLGELGERAFARGFGRVQKRVNALFGERDQFWLAVQVAGDDEGSVADVMAALAGELTVAARAARKPGARGPAVRPPARVTALNDKERQVATTNLAAIEFWPWGAASDAARDAARPGGGLGAGCPDLTTFPPSEELRTPETYLQRDLELDPFLSRVRGLASPDEAAALWRLPTVPSGGQAGLTSRLPNPFEQLPVEMPPGDDMISLGVVQHRGLGTEQEYRVPLTFRFGTQPGIGDRVLVVAGSPGAGKTNFTLAFLEQLWNTKRRAAERWSAERNRVESRCTPYLVIDPTRGQEFRWLVDQAPDDVVVFTVGDTREEPFCFNPFIIPKDVSLQAHVSRMMSCFRAAYHMWDPLPAIFEEAIRKAYQRKMARLGRPWDPQRTFGTGRADDYPDLSDVCAAMGTGAAGETGTVLAEQRQLWSADGQGTENQATIVASTYLRLRNLRDNYDSILGGAAPGRPAVDLTKLLKVPCVLELGMIGDDQALALVMAFLVVSLAGCIETRNRKTDPLHVLVLEEAHRLLSAEGGASAEGANSKAQAAEGINNLLAEVRKYGQGVMLLDQRPGSLVGGAIDNAYLVALHRLNERKSFDQFADMLNLNPAQRRFARVGLLPGETVILDRSSAMPVVLRPKEKEKEKTKELEADPAVKAARAAAARERVARLMFDPPDPGAELVARCRATPGLAAKLDQLAAVARDPTAPAKQVDQLAFELAMDMGLGKGERVDAAAKIVARLRADADTRRG